MIEQKFIGRKQQLAQLKSSLDRALREGQGQIVFVVGEWGSGKKTLIREFAKRAKENHANVIVATGTCDETIGQNKPYLPFTEVLKQLTDDTNEAKPTDAMQEDTNRTLRERLRDLVRDLTFAGPALGIKGPDRERLRSLMDQLERPEESKTTVSTNDGGSGQSQIFEQYTETLKINAAQQPLIVRLNDLQWADGASITLLHYLSGRIAQSRILIIGTYRSDEIERGRDGKRHPLKKVIDEIGRDFGADICLNLDQAAKDEGQRFVDELLDTEPNRLGDEFRQELFRRTGGNPFFTTQLLQAMQDRGKRSELGGLLRDEKGRWIEGPNMDWETLPDKVGGVVEERIDRLEEEELREILRVASVQGKDFTAQVVAHVRQIEEPQLLWKLSEELERRHCLVKELSEFKVGSQTLSAYEFAHPLFQQYLYNRLGYGYRRDLHARIARRLEELYAGRTGEIAPELARHYIKAGKEEKAVDYLLQMGDEARTQFASQEAIRAYVSATQFLEKHIQFLEEQGADGQERKAAYERAAQTLYKLRDTYSKVSGQHQQMHESDKKAHKMLQEAAKLGLSAASPTAPHALRLWWFEPKTLDPSIAEETRSSCVIDTLFSGLMKYGSEMIVRPEAADWYPEGEEGRRYVFLLRDNLRWSDRSRVTAEDFEYTWKRVLDPATGTGNAEYLYDIKGARAFHQGEELDPTTIGVWARGEGTLVVELEGSSSYFFNILAHCSAYAVPKHVLTGDREEWAKPGRIITNGPFRLESWQPGESMVLSRNHNYPKDRFKGNVERVEISLLKTSDKHKDSDKKLKMYEADELDILPLWHVWEVEYARQRYAAEEHIVAPELSTDYIGFNVRGRPFNDPQVRQAFACAVKQEILAEEIQKNVVLPATGGLVPEGMEGHSEGIGLRYDPQQARELLAAAGYPGGKSFPTIEVLTTGSSTIEYLKAQWREILGIEITARTVDPTEHGYRLDKLSTSMLPSMFIASWLADYPDPDSFLRVGNWRRRTGWRNETYNQLVEQARRVAEQEERVKLYRQADEILIRDAVIVPLGYKQRHLLVKPWVKGFHTSAIYWWFWQDITIEPH